MSKFKPPGNSCQHWVDRMGHAALDELAVPAEKNVTREKPSLRGWCTLSAAEVVEAKCSVQMPIGLQNKNSGRERLIRADRLELEVCGDLKRRVQGRFRHAGNVHALLEHDPLRECSYPENHEGACPVGECWLALNHTGGYGGVIRRLIAAIIEP